MVMRNENIPKQEIVDLIALFVEKKDRDITIHTKERDTNISMRKTHDSDIIDCTADACCAIVVSI